MKLIFAEEDCVYGILMGIIIVGLTGKYIKIPSWPIIYGIAFSISLILSFMDIAHSFSGMHRHPGIITLHWITIVIDMILEITFITFFFNIQIPFISTVLFSFIKNNTILFYIGVYFVVSNIFWTVASPLTD